MSLDFEKMFHDYVDQNQKEWAHDRGSTLGASEAFGCLRKAFFDKFGEELGYEQDEKYEDSWGAMKRGDVIEDHWVVPVLEDQVGKQVPGAQLFLAGANEQMTYVNGKNSATPDGLVTGLAKDALIKYGIENIKTNCILVEVKSVDPRVSLTEEKAIHEGQVQIQMGLMHEMTTHRPFYAVIIYIDASFFDNIKVFVVEYDESTYRAAKLRAKKLFSVEGPEELPAEGKIEGACTYCRWQTMCAEVSQEAIPSSNNMDAFDDEDLKMLRDLAEEDRKLAKDIKDLEHDKEQARARIKQLLADKDSNRAKGEGFSISYSWQKGRKTLNKKRLEEETGIELASFEEEGNGFEKLTIRLD